MPKGNIITVFDCTNDDLVLIEQAIAAVNATFVRKENTLYVNSPTINAVRIIETRLTELNVTYIMFYNNIATGSAVRSCNVDDDFIKEVKQLLQIQN